VSIGDSLAEARRQAGLTITQVSQQTRIRETIIASIEQDDFSPCGGDFYARGHIRSIASAVGTDPVTLIREYDEEHGSPGPMRASQIFESATPIRIREPRRLRLGWVIAVAAVAVAGFLSYHALAGHGSNSAAAATSRVRSIAKAKPPATAKPTADKNKNKNKNKTTHPAANAKPQAVIKLTASQDCWVKLTAASGQSIYEGTIQAGSSMTWHEKHAVSMVIGNPPGIALSVNGKAEQMNTVQVVTLGIDPLSQRPVTVG
jgi:cytoskeletal protein RodZ